MTGDTPLARRGSGPEPGHPLPTLADLVARIGGELAAHRRLGLLTVSVLPTGRTETSDSWPGYDAMHREIEQFLREYMCRKMRSSDGLFAPGMSGNGFVVLLDSPRVKRSLEPADVSRVRVRLRRGLRAHLKRHVSDPTLRGFGCYVGGAMLRHEDGVRVERIAYRALDEAFADALQEKDREERGQVASLLRVIERGRIRSVYQPVLDLAARRVIGVEALTRGPRARFVSPDQMFKIAQENQALWSLERLCRRKAVEGAPRLETSQLLFLNIEPDSLHDPDLLQPSFDRLLTLAGLRPGQIVLEMTERTAVRDFAAVRRTLGEIRKRGFHLAMDDVGSGYSGLQSIAEISPDFIKVDMTLVRDIQHHAIKRELITTFRRFSDSTGITLVAEGVETPAELESLMAAGVRCAQGYLFARPSSPPTWPDWRMIPRFR